MTPSRLVLLALALCSAACTRRLESLAVLPLTSPPLGGTASAAGISIRAGTAIAVRIVAYTEDPGGGASNCTTLGDTFTSCESPQDSVAASSLRVGVEGDAASLFGVEDDVFVVLGAAPGPANLAVSSTDAVGTLRVAVQIFPQ